MSQGVTSQLQTSRGLRLLGRFLTRSWQALVVVLLALALGVAAILSPGLVQADVRLDEGTVYPGNQDLAMVGTLNAQIDELADATPVGTSRFNILQHEDTVLVHGPASSSLVRYNPGRNRLEAPLQLPSNAQVSLGGQLIAVSSPDNGRVWFGEADTVLRFDFQSQKATMEIGEFGVSTITTTGQLISLNVQTSELMRPGDDDEPDRVRLPFSIDADAPNVQLSAVGDRAVVLDANAGRIWVEGMADWFEVSGAGTAQLAAPAPDALGGEDGARAIYATQAGLIAVTPDGPRSLSGQLDAGPIRPVQVDDCVYAAFGNQFVKKCRGEAAHIIDVPEVPAGAQLTFHVNRSTVILNDMASGVIWMVNKDMLMITDWERVSPPSEDSPTSEVTVEQVIPPDRDQDNTPPIAEDDHLAARAGRATILPVLDNDTDPDGDVLTISAPTELDGASLQRVRGGSGLQVTVDADATGDLQFDYTVSDGRGGTDSATVTVRIVPADPTADNNAPFKHHLAQPLTVPLGSTVTKRVLLDWRDPEGDPLVLVGAWLDPDVEDEVSFTPDGTITFRDIGKTTGTKVVHVEVSDGYASTQGEMQVVVTDESVAPIAYGDFETVRVGETVTVEPLLNDVGANLRLTEVEWDEAADLRVSPNYREDYFEFSADAPGVHYVTYQVSNPVVAMGLVRIDVLPDTSDQLPVAALDVALLPPGGSVTIDPLLNDTSPRGDVLVVQSVSPADGLEVVLERRHLVTITEVTRQQEPVTLTYRVSDGRNSVEGSIIVLPTTSSGSVQPQAEDDTVNIRAGSIQSVDVLANDVSPIGLELFLDGLVENPFGERAWIDGDRIRVDVAAGAGATTSSITYQIRDEEGRISSAQLEVRVRSEDDQNEPPVPRQVTDRVLAGTSHRISVPLEDIDINGDAVRLVGLGSGPTLGRVTGIGDGWMIYEAFPTSQGTDSFRYRVTDALGLVGEGEIRIGVAPPSAENTPPVGVMDEVVTRPGSHVQIAALRNDVDVDGDTISYASSDPVEMEGIDDVEIIGSREIAFTAPMEEGVYRGVYHIEDSRGMPGSGDIILTVDAEAELLPPQARDDLVPVSAVAGRDWVEVDVLSNDFDPDGPHEQLRVLVPDQTDEQDSARSAEDGRGVIVPITEHMQQVRYVVTDGDGLSASAIVTIPGRNDSVPVLTDPDVSFEVTAGQPLSLQVGTLVTGTQGRSVRLTSVDNVTATHGTVAPGPERMDYTPDLEYAGPASIVFEVADVVPEGDRSGKNAFISVPVQVLPAEHQRETDDEGGLEDVIRPPELIGDPPVIHVGPDEGEARRDLRPLFRVHTGGNVFFENFTAVEGDSSIDWRYDQVGMVYASAPITAQPGTYRIVRGEVVDARGARSDFTVRLEVVSSTRPRPVAANVSIDQAFAGQEISVPVLTESRSNLVSNPELHLVGQPSVIAGSGSAVAEGDVVRITPADGFVGTMTVSFTIVDATLDPGRHVDGFIRVTVQDRPSRPGAPRDGVAGNGYVTFTYTPGSSNGLEITRRVVTPVRADGTQLPPTECPSTTCTVRNLPNGVGYRFQVIEENDAGASDPSPLSAEYTPDQIPMAPVAQMAGFGNGSLSTTWSHPDWEDPSNPGSAITSYTVQLLDLGGAVLQTREVGPASREYTWSGLTNGTRYRFSLLATNQAGTSPASAPTDADYPAAPPGAPGSVVASPKMTDLGGSFDVTWNTAIEENGDPVSTWWVVPVTREGAGTPIAFTPRGGATQTESIEGLRQVEYRFQVFAQNKAGEGQRGQSPEWQTAWRLPVVGDDVAVSRGDAQLTISFTSNFENVPQANPVKQYRLGSGDWRNLPAGGVVAGLVNGRLYDVSVRVSIDGRTSGDRSAGSHRPRTPAPLWPTILDAGTLRSTDRVMVSAHVLRDWEATGGWDPDGYRANCGGSGNGCERIRGSAFEFSAPSTAVINMMHTEYPEATHDLPVEVRSVFSGSWDPESRQLDFTIRYMDNGYCVVGIGEHEERINHPGGNSFVVSRTLDETVTGNRVSLACTSSDMTRPANYDIN